MKNFQRNKVTTILFKLWSRITISLACALLVLNAQAQTISDITGNVEQLGFLVPGIACKTRTNDDSSVRNLAHGVFNRDSNELVALNCGWTMPYAWSGAIPGVGVEGTVFAAFVRSANVSPEVANQAECTIAVSSEFDANPNPNTDGYTLGTMRADFAEAQPFPDLSFPALFFDPSLLPGTFNFFSAFCRLPRGVRIQAFDVDPSVIVDPIPIP